jgi:ankyrin repeat protein
VAVVQLLLQHVVGIDKAPQSARLLHEACHAGNNDILAILLELSLDLDGVDKEGCTPLDIACNSGQLSMAKALLDRGCAINARAVQYACQGGHDACVALLLDRRADVNDDTSCALHSACASGHYSTACLLLERRADIDRVDLLGTALHQACQGGHERVALLLIDQGANTAIPYVCEMSYQM